MDPTKPSNPTPAAAKIPKPTPAPIPAPTPASEEPFGSSVASKLSTEEIEAQLEKFTAPENVVQNIDSIIQMVKALEKMKAKAQAGTYRDRAVQALINIAEEHTSYQSWDNARHTFEQAKRLAQNNPEIIKGLKLVQGKLKGEATTKTSPANEPTAKETLAAQAVQNPPVKPAEPGVPTPSPSLSPDGGEALPTGKAGIISALETLVEPDSVAGHVSDIISMTKKLEKLGAGLKAKEFRQRAVKSLIDIAEEHGSYQDFASAKGTYGLALQIIPNHPDVLKSLEFIRDK